jgi:hypothetical protein
MQVPPQRPRINLAETGNSADAKEFYDAIRYNYGALLTQASEGEVVELEYHSLRGEIIRVTQLTHDARRNMLILRGRDANGNKCNVISKAQGLQVIFRVWTPQQESAIAEPERKRIGFTSE